MYDKPNHLHFLELCNKFICIKLIIYRNLSISDYLLYIANCKLNITSHFTLSLNFTRYSFKHVYPNTFKEKKNLENKTR